MKERVLKGQRAALKEKGRHGRGRRVLCALFGCEEDLMWGIPRNSFAWCGRGARLRCETGAETVQVAFALALSAAFGVGLLALQGGIGVMGAGAMGAINERYAALAVIDPGLEQSEPGGIDVPVDDGEVPADDTEAGGGTGAEGGAESGDTELEGELPEVEFDGAVDSTIDNDL